MRGNPTSVSGAPEGEIPVGYPTPLPNFFADQPHATNIDKSCAPAFRSRFPHFPGARMSLYEFTVYGQAKLQRLHPAPVVALSAARAALRSGARPADGGSRAWWVQTTKVRTTAPSKIR